MILPEKLERAIGNSRRFVRESYQDGMHLHWHPLGFRQFIYHFLGEGEDAHLGFQRQCYLSILAAESQLPAWFRTFPNNDLPETVLKFARQIVREGKSESIRHRPKLLDRTFRDLGNQYPERRHTISVGYAAVAALRQSLSGERFAFGAQADPDRTLLDEAIEPAERDASFYAECAAAGGPYWWAGSDAGKRLAFWENWLDVTLPNAFALNWKPEMDA